MRVRGSEEISQVVSAWREAGGTFYKVELRCAPFGSLAPMLCTSMKAHGLFVLCRRKLVWDMQHVLSCKVCCMRLEGTAV